MEKFFLNILDMSVVGTYIILAVLVARFFLQKSPKIFSYLLWSVVFFRLLCPFTFHSPMSLLPKQAQRVDFSNFAEVSSVADEFFFESKDVFIDEQAIPLDRIQNVEQLETIVIHHQNMQINQVLQIIWLCGMVIIIICSLVSFLKLKNILKSAMYLEKNIYFTDNIDTPLVFGLWNPIIYLPSNINEEELGYIVAHEQEHIRRFDHFTRPICLFAVIIHWFNPFVWIAYNTSTKDMELSCDEAVLKEKSVKIRGEYARTLLKFSGDGNYLTHLAFSENNTKGRVKNIMKMKKKKLWATGLSSVLVMGLVVGFASDSTEESPNFYEPTEVEQQLYWDRLTGKEPYDRSDPKTISTDYPYYSSARGGTPYEFDASIYDSWIWELDTYSMTYGAGYMLTRLIPDVNLSKYISSFPDENMEGYVRQTVTESNSVLKFEVGEDNAYPQVYISNYSEGQISYYVSRNTPDGEPITMLHKLGQGFHVVNYADWAFESGEYYVHFLSDLDSINVDTVCTIAPDYFYMIGVMNTIEKYS